MGALDYLSNFCTVTSTRSKRKAMQVPTSSCNTCNLLLSFCFLLFFLFHSCAFWLLFSWAVFLCFVSQTVEIKVKMDCDGCERRVKNAVTSMKGSIYHEALFRRKICLTITISFLFCRYESKFSYLLLHSFSSARISAHFMI